jgi:hypothetical protein
VRRNSSDCLRLKSVSWDHSGLARSQGLQMWRVAANILNIQLRTADKGMDLKVGEYLLPCSSESFVFASVV